MSLPTPQHVLVVDDEPLVRQHVRAVLEDKGYAVTEAASADEALLLLVSGEITTVLADIEMPGEDGLWLLRTIRSKWPDSKLIIMSDAGLTSRGNVPEGIKVLTKPFSADLLLQILESG